MKVCILGPVTTRTYFGGVAVFDEQLALGFFQLGYSVSIVTYQKNISLGQLFDCIPVVYIRNQSSFSSWLNKEKPDLIIGSLDYPKLLPQNKLSSKIIYFLHGFFTRSYYGFVKSLLAPIYQKYLMRKADFIFANSDFTKMVNQEFFDIHVDKVFHLGVSDDFLSKTEKTNLYKKEKGNILFVGRLVSAKGVDKLLKAAKMLKDDGIIYNLLIVGDGPDRDKLEQYARNNALNIKFLGKIKHEKTCELYGQSEIFVSLNPSEPFGITFVEALLSSCKIICPTTGGQVEFLQKWNNSVEFVSSDSVTNLYLGIKKLLKSGEYPVLNREEKKVFSYKFIAKEMVEYISRKDKLD